jgi:hypothetical protein
VLAWIGLVLMYDPATMDTVLQHVPGFCQLSGGWNGFNPGKEKLTPLIQPAIGSEVPGCRSFHSGPLPSACQFRSFGL